jgi:hypothetical protein
MDSLTGKTIKWTFDDGPMPGTSFEHSFDDDGSVTWRILDGEYKGATAREKSYGMLKVNDKTLAISYLSAAGHTLTVVLNFDNGSAFGFGSNEKSWSSFRGRFELVQ